jgi:hypothetical protein
MQIHKKVISLNGILSTFRKLTQYIMLRKLREITKNGRWSWPDLRHHPDIWQKRLTKSNGGSNNKRLGFAQYYSGTSNFEHNPFDFQVVRLSSKISPFELIVPEPQNLPNRKHFTCLFRKIILLGNDETSIFIFNKWMYLFAIVHT